MHTETCLNHTVGFLCNDRTKALGLSYVVRDFVHVWFCVNRPQT